ncbi:MAG: Ni/Fe hydrogenase subunit alpha [Candidatus Helarchaeota archaeon]
MSKELKIQPITRLEGHGDITIKLGAGNKVEDVQINVTSTRFFEKFFEGRPAEHAPRLAPRICGICPIPHHLTSVKAVEGAWGVWDKIPRPAYKLRELMIQAKQVSSHVLHIAALQLPDLVFGPLAPPEKRNVVAIINAAPELGKKVFAAMRFGQELCRAVGGKAVHPVTAIPGGMAKPLDEDTRQKFLKMIPTVVEIGKEIVEIGDKLVNDYIDVITKFAVTPTFYIGLCKENGEHTIWEDSWQKKAHLRVMNKEGKIVEDKPSYEYMDFVGEYVSPHSMATHVFHKPTGYPEGLWRTNTLARLNVCDKMDSRSPMAQELLDKFRKTVGRPCHMTFAYIWARIIETIAAVEIIASLLGDDEIVSTDVKNPNIEPKAGNLAGVSEAPRGTLIHHYWTDDKGIITKANMVVATNHNIGGAELSIKTAAKNIWEDKILDSIKLPEPMFK